MPCISRRAIPKLPSPLIHIAALGPHFTVDGRRSTTEGAGGRLGGRPRHARHHEAGGPQSSRHRAAENDRHHPLRHPGRKRHTCPRVPPHPRRHRRSLGPGREVRPCSDALARPSAKGAPSLTNCLPQTHPPPPHAPDPTPKTAPITPYTGRTAGPGNATAPRDAEPHTGAQSALLAITVRATPVGGGRPARDRSLPSSTRCPRACGSDPAPPTRRQPGPCLRPALYPPDT